MRYAKPQVYLLHFLAYESHLSRTLDVIDDNDNDNDDDDDVVVVVVVGVGGGGGGGGDGDVDEYPLVGKVSKTKKRKKPNIGLDIGYRIKWEIESQE